MKITIKNMDVKFYRTLIKSGCKLFHTVEFKDDDLVDVETCDTVTIRTTPSEHEILITDELPHNGACTIYERDWWSIPVTAFTVIRIY